MEHSMEKFMNSLHYQLNAKEDYFKKIPFSELNKFRRNEAESNAQVKLDSAKNLEEMRRQNIYKVVLKEYSRELEKMNKKNT